MVKVVAILAACIITCYQGYAQRISLKENRTPLDNVLKKIERQSDYLFWYELPLLKIAQPVTVTATNLSITQALDYCLKNQPLTYTIVGKTIVITKKKEPDTPDTELSIQETFLDSANSSLDEVVFVGYGAFAKRNISGAVSKIFASSTERQPVASVDQAIAGQAAGVYVAHLTGTPGGGTAIRIRGTGSITAGNEPLIVIDGFPIEGSYDRDLNPLATMNPNDIESIEVLKDASSAAIYGSRGSNGVVLITTKKGSPGSPVLTFDTYTGLQQVLQKIPLLNAQEYAALNTEARNNAWEDLGGNRNDPNDERPDRLKIPNMFSTPFAQGKGTDWQDEIFITAPVNSYQLSVSAGNDNNRYFLSGSYFDQEGIVTNTRFQRYSFRFNFDSRISKKFSVGVNIAPTYSKNNALLVDDQVFGGGILGSALAMPPTMPVYNADGSYATVLPASVFQFGAFDNPVAIANQFKRGTSVFRVLANLFATWNITEDLRFKSSIGVEYYDGRYSDYWPSTLARNGSVPPIDAEANASTTRQLVWLNENTLTYSKQFGSNHSLNALAGYTAQRAAIDDTYMKAVNFPNDEVTTINAGQIISGGTAHFDWSLLSYLGRIHYNYDSKYLLTLTVRRDGSSRFGPNNRWATFPSVSAGWNIARENFMRDAEDVINELKLRGSYGHAGNNSIGNYTFQGILSPDAYVFGPGTGTVVQGAQLINLSNPNLSWEVMKQANVGIDIGAIRNRIRATLDYYYKITSDLLLDVPIPGSTGFSSSLQNIGRVMNKGLEVTINSENIKTDKVSWQSGFNISFYTNKVLELGANGDPIITTSRGFSQQTHKTEIGMPIGSFYGYEVIGVYRDQTDVDAGPTMTGTDASRPGDLKFKDNDGDGQITPFDRVVLGNSMPDLAYGFTNVFSYKNLSLSILIDGAAGNEVLNGSRRNIELTTHSYSRRDVLGRWRSPENPGDGRTPRANTNPTGGNVAFVSSLFIEDASFMRVRNINLQWKFSRLLRQKHIQDAAVYVSVQNAFLISKYKGFNPEQSLNGTNPLLQGIEYNGYPLARVFAVGLNIAFQ
jgi:TonB-linked SusC/RagA family outer membrane protein